jgi:hypothetical protein
VNPAQVCAAVARARHIMRSDNPCEREDGMDQALAEIVLAMFVGWEEFSEEHQRADDAPSRNADLRRKPAYRQGPRKDLATVVELTEDQIERYRQGERDPVKLGLFEGVHGAFVGTAT